MDEKAAWKSKIVVLLELWRVAIGTGGLTGVPWVLHIHEVSGDVKMASLTMEVKHFVPSSLVRLFTSDISGRWKKKG